MFDNYSTVAPVAPVAHVAKAEAVQVIHTYRKLQNPEQVARLFSIHLSVDKGYSNTMVVTRKGWRVICDEDQRAVDFNR